MNMHVPSDFFRTRFLNFEELDDVGLPRRRKSARVAMAYRMKTIASENFV